MLLTTPPYTMYPDWPRSDADLVPLPRCDGPKLEPFDFGGAQAIEFLGYIGEGLHAHVFKGADLRADLRAQAGRLPTMA